MIFVISLTTKQTQIMKKVSILCAALLVVACFQLPMGYYTFLRIAITIGALLTFIGQTKKDVNPVGIAFIIITILFNPIFPVHLNSKTIWMPIDIIAAALFLIAGFKNKE